MMRERLGPYRIVRPLGTGAMGDVFEAVHEALGRTVKPGYAKDAEEAAKAYASGSAKDHEELESLFVGMKGKTWTAAPDGKSASLKVTQKDANGKDVTVDNVMVHIFAGDWYSAGYYSYLWSDVLNADAYEAFTEAGGPYDKAVAKKLRDHVFDVGNTIDPTDAYRAFRGRDAKIDALMRKRGFAVRGQHTEGGAPAPR